MQTQEKKIKHNTFENFDKQNKNMKATDVMITIFGKSLSMQYVYLRLITFQIKQMYFFMFYPNTLSAFKPNIYMEWIEINETNRNSIHFDQMIQSPKNKHNIINRTQIAFSNSDI